MKKCKNHKLEMSWRCGTNIGLKCHKCGATEDRPMTKQEIKTYKKWDILSDKHCKEIHALFHAFERKFKDYKVSTLRFKWSGYDLMQRVERFAAKHKDIKICDIDDAYSAGSFMVIIPHKRKGEYWGTTFVYIPQCTEEQPTEFFMYPSHLKYILPELQNIDKLTKKLNKGNED